MFLDFVPRTLVPLIVLLEQKTWSVSLKKEWTVHFSLTYEATRIGLFLIRKQFYYYKFIYYRYLISSNFSKRVIRLINTTLQKLKLDIFYLSINSTLKIRMSSVIFLQVQYPIQPLRMRISYTGQLTHCSVPCPVSACTIINHNLRKETSLYKMYYAR